MRRFLLYLTTVFAVGTAFARAVAEDVIFQSSTYASFRQLLTGAAATSSLDIHATLGLPPVTRGQLPAVVMVHSLAGYRDDNEGWQADALRQAGFATLTYDSFAARGMGDLVNTPRRGPPPYASALADAFGALAALARDPRIDPGHIAILGFSFGGEVAHDTAIERIRATLAVSGERFAAHVAYYPAGVYGVVADQNAYTGAPVLLMIGGNDTLPVQKANAYLAYTRSAGHLAPVELIVYRDAYHGWTNPALGEAREYPYLASTRACPFALITPSNGLALLVEGEERPFNDRLFNSCIVGSLGYTMGYNETTRALSTAEAVKFLLRTIAP